MNILSKIQMIPDQFINAGIIFVLLILFYILYSTIKNDRSTKIKQIEKVISLEQLSELWMKKNSSSIEVSLDVLTPIWREVENESEEPDIVLRHDRARKFWIRISKYFKRFPIHRQICAHIITILDKDGDCPSVVNKKSFVNDIESSWDSNSYSMLGMTKLIDHSINVAEHVIDLLTDIEAQHVIPDGIIAALAHDIGKIPSLQSHLYASGDHPIVAGSILPTLTGFKDLPEHDRTVIAQAIKHHHINCEGLLPQNVRRADQLARQDEMDWAVQELAGSQDELTKPSPQPAGAGTPGNQQANSQASAAQGQSPPQPVLEANAPGPVGNAMPVNTLGTAAPVAAPQIAEPEEIKQKLVTPEEAVATGASMRDFLTAGPADPADDEETDTVDDDDEEEADALPDDQGTENDDDETCPSFETMFSGSAQPSQQIPEQEDGYDTADDGSDNDEDEENIPTEAEPVHVDQPAPPAIPQPAPVSGVPMQTLPRLAPDPYPDQSGVPAGMENVKPGDPSKAYAADNAIYGSGQSAAAQQGQTATKKDAPQVISLGNWFDEHVLIDKLKPHINKTSGKSFKAFSMPDGIVYIQTGFIEIILKSMASENNIAEIATLVSGCKEMKDIIMSVVTRLRDKGYIEETLMQKGYYGGYFLIQKRSGSTQPGYFTPFRAETFGMPSELEELKDIYKSRYVLDFVNVAPKIGYDK